MSDNIQKIATGLAESQHRAALEAEIRAIKKKETEINAAGAIIYAALSRWTGQEVTKGTKIPVCRGGKKVGQLPLTTMGLQEVDWVLMAARLESAGEMRETRRKLSEAADAANVLLDTVTNLSRSDWAKLESRKNNELGDLSVKIIGTVGVISSAAIACQELRKHIQSELVELDARLQKVGKSLGRPPNLAAHEVALRLAKLYAKITGQRPTYSEGANGLSGEYTPLLRDVFDALGWQTLSLRGPAQKATKSISDSDFQYEEIGILGRLSAGWTK